MIVQGINLDTLPEQFQLQNQGLTLLLDGDFNVYRAAATVKTLGTAIRRFYQEVLTEMFLVGVTQCEVFITPSGCAKCNRYWYPTVKKYQDNRANKVHLPLKDPLKHHLMQNPLEYREQGITVCFDDWFEADDSIVTRAYQLGSECVVSSGDKDLRLAPQARWDAKTGSIQPALENQFGYLLLDRIEAAPVKGHGTKFFWWQMLAGDTADNVKGIQKLHGKDCGAIGGYEALDCITDETEAAEFVIRAYAEIQQDALAEAEMLWLRRSEDDSGYKYLMEVVKDTQLRDWLQSLSQYHTEYIKYQLENLND